MEVVGHPYLEGVLCRSDGAIFVPFGGSGMASHWTFGTCDKDGYRVVWIAHKARKVHRLMAEAFLQCPIPNGMQIDHIDRCPSNNKLENIRITTPSENNRNKKVCEEALAKYGVSYADDPAAYDRSRYANNSEYREKRKARARAYYAKKKKGKEK